MAYCADYHVFTFYYVDYFTCKPINVRYTQKVILCTTLACYSILFSLDATCFCEKWERWPFENIIAEPTHIFLFLLPLAICSKVSFNNKMFQAGDRRHIFLTAFLNNVCTIKAKTIVAFFRKWGRRVRIFGCFRTKSNSLKSAFLEY